jgi:hypothetical protein
MPVADSVARLVGEGPGVGTVRTRVRRSSRERRRETKGA